MRANPRDWRIDDIESVCRAFAGTGIKFRAPSGGSHYTVRHSKTGILTIPAGRPIKPVYVKKFIEFVEIVLSSE